MAMKASNENDIQYYLMTMKINKYNRKYNEENII